MPSEPLFPLQAHLGMDVASPDRGRGRATLEVDPGLHNPNGVLHGAVLFAMVDTAMGAATMSALDEGQVCASIEVHLRFFRPVVEGRVTAEVEVTRQGRRIIHLDGRVRDEAGELVAAADGSFAIIVPA